MNKYPERWQGKTTAEKEDKMIRVIYMIEEITDEGDLVSRRFARNKRTADRIARKAENGASVRKLQKSEMVWVRREDIER